MITQLFENAVESVEIIDIKDINALKELTEQELVLVGGGGGDVALA